MSLANPHTTRETERYERYLTTERHAAALTTSAYLRDLRQFIDYLQATGKDDIAKVTAQDVRRWVLTLMDKEGDTPRSVRRKLSSLNSFFRFEMREGKMTKNPARLVIVPKMAKTLPYFFQEKEMDAALDRQEANGEEETLEEMRDQLILDLFYQTGMRVSELCNVKESDFDYSRRSLKVIGKRQKERRIPLGDGIFASVRAYVERRNAEIGGTERLLTRMSGEAVYPRMVYNIVKEHMSRVSTLGKRSPHVLRHTFASTLLNAGADIYAVKELLGHASLASTEIYTHSTFAQLLKTYKQAHPRGS